MEDMEDEEGDQSFLERTDMKMRVVTFQLLLVVAAVMLPAAFE
jgi:hypothetical protein